MTYAITHAANAVVPVTWTSNGNVVTVQNWPTNFHAAYTGDQHTATVVQLADTPRQAPQQAPDLSAGGVAGLSGATLIGLGLVVWTAAKWKQKSKEAKWAFAKGVIATILIGSWGIFGTLTHTVKQTGDSTGASVANIGAGGQ